MILDCEFHYRFHRINIFERVLPWHQFSCFTNRHGPKPDSHEAEAEAFKKLEAEAKPLTHINLKAEALFTKPKPKPGYLYYTRYMCFCNQNDWLQSWSFGKPRSQSLWSQSWSHGRCFWLYSAMGMCMFSMYVMLGCSSHTIRNVECQLRCILITFFILAEYPNTNPLLHWCFPIRSDITGRAISSCIGKHQCNNGFIFILHVSRVCSGDVIQNHKHLMSEIGLNFSISGWAVQYQVLLYRK